MSYPSCMESLSSVWRQNSMRKEIRLKENKLFGYAWIVIYSSFCFIHLYNVCFIIVPFINFENLKMLSLLN